jgi:hypothetical protein
MKHISIFDEVQHLLNKAKQQNRVEEPDPFDGGCAADCQPDPKAAADATINEQKVALKRLYDSAKGLKLELERIADRVDQNTIDHDDLYDLLVMVGMRAATLERQIAEVPR